MRSRWTSSAPWFQCTTWGRTDEVIHGEPLEDDKGYATQDAKEVWFRGFHSDIGGGTKERKSARVALLWMLGEAAHFGLRLNKEVGVARFDRKKDFNRKIKPHDSRTWWWPVVGVVPREELRNDWRPPQRDRVTGSKSPRNPLLPELKEGQDRREVLVHVSALDAVRLPHVRIIRRGRCKLTRGHRKIRLAPLPSGDAHATPLATRHGRRVVTSANGQDCLGEYSPLLAGHRVRTLQTRCGIQLRFTR